MEKFNSPERIPERTEIIGKRLKLIEIQPYDDLDKLLEWRNSDEYQEKCLSFKKTINKEMLIEEIRRDYLCDKHAHFLAIDNSGNTIGTSLIYNFNNKNKIAYTTTFVAPERRNNAYFGVEMFLLACRYMFKTLGCRKVYSEVHSDNQESRTIFEKLVLSLEAKFKDHVMISENIFSDLLVFALYREEFTSSDLAKRILENN